MARCEIHNKLTYLIVCNRCIINIRELILKDLEKTANNIDTKSQLNAMGAKILIKEFIKNQRGAAVFVLFNGN